MRDFLASLLLLLSIFIGYAQCQSADSSDVFPKSVEIHHSALNSAQSSVLAKIAYNPETLQSKVLSYTPPSPSANDGPETIYQIMIRVQAPDGSKQWVSSLASQSALTQQHNKNNSVIQLYLSPSQPHDIYHVSLAQSSSEISSEPIAVELIYPDAGALPELNKPVVLSPDGTAPQEVVEKTFFQKYWWVFLLVSFLALSGGGGEGGR